MLARRIRRRPAHRFIEAPVTREILQNAARRRSQRNHRRQRRRAARHRALRIHHHHVVARRIARRHRRNRERRRRRPANRHRALPPLIRQRRTASHDRKSRRPANRLSLRTRRRADDRRRSHFLRERHRRNRRIPRQIRQPPIQPQVDAVRIRHRAQPQHPIERTALRHQPIVLRHHPIHQHIHYATTRRRERIQRENIDDVSLPHSRREFHHKKARAPMQPALAERVPRSLLRRPRPRKTANRISQRSRGKSDPRRRIIHAEIARQRSAQKGHRRRIRRTVPEVPPLARRIAIAQKIRRKPKHRRIRNHLHRTRRDRATKQKCCEEKKTFHGQMKDTPTPSPAQSKAK